MEFVSSKLVRDLANQKYVLAILKNMGMVEMFAKNYLQSKIVSSICELVPFVCDFMIELVADAESDYNNQARLDVFMGHYPSGSSLRSFEHFAQIIKSGKFQKYDYGFEENLEKHGNSFPPEIALKNIKDAKIIQIVGTYDHLSPLKDNEWLSQQLESNIIFYKTYPLGHTSFLLAKDMAYVVDTINMFKKNAWE